MTTTMEIARSDDLVPEVLEKLRHLNEEAHRHPFVEDWEHALGGTHFFVEERGEPVSHACVVERTLETGGRALRTGYVEAVATHPRRQREGHASRVMRAITDHIASEYELGALCTGKNRFFERFGWETWGGPTFVRTKTGRVRTDHEDGNVMILRTRRTLEIDITAGISCEWRRGDVW